MKMNRLKIKAIQFVICIGLLCVIWTSYIYLKKLKQQMIEVREDDFSWVFQVDSAERKEGDIVVRGFAFELSKNSEAGAYEIVLEDIESGKRYFPKMAYRERKDVNDYFLCEYNYKNSGFEARIKARKMNFEEKNYEVLLKVSGKSLAYHTGTYVSKGQLMYTNPSDFQVIEEPELELKKVIENGALRAYNADYKMYVYQYEGELYWITDSSYEFDKNGRTYIEYQMNTTQVNKLPKHRLDAGWTWSNIGFVFEECTVPLMSNANWRVAKVSIPTEYSVTKIWTGSYKDEWIWNLNFRPRYEFEG